MIWFIQFGSLIIFSNFNFQFNQVTEINGENRTIHVCIYIVKWSPATFNHLSSQFTPSPSLSNLLTKSPSLSCLLLLLCHTFQISTSHPFLLVSPLNLGISSPKAKSPSSRCVDATHLPHMHSSFVEYVKSRMMEDIPIGMLNLKGPGVCD